MLMTRLNEHSGIFAQWFSIVRVIYLHCVISDSQDFAPDPVGLWKCCRAANDFECV